MSEVLLESVLVCPVCGFAKSETMPTDACQFFYECVSCKTLLRPKSGDCCVFCSYGSVKCPPMQGENRACCATGKFLTPADRSARMKQSLQSDVLISLFAPWEGQAPATIVKDLISFKPTRHVLNTASGVRFFTCCAVDTLLIVHLLDEDGDIDTTPPEEIQPLHISVRGAQAHVSSNAVIAIPVQHNDQEIWTTFCPYSNVFPDEDHTRPIALSVKAQKKWLEWFFNSATQQR